MSQDSLWKEAVEQYFGPLLALFFPDVHHDVDFGRGYEFLNKELAEIALEGETGRRYADSLVKVFLKDGTERWLVIHIDVQGYRDPNFERRMFIYNYRTFDRYDADVVTLVILTDPNFHYRPHCFQVAHWGFRCLFEFPTVKLLDYRERWAELEQSDSPFAVLVMAHLKAQETRKRSDERLFWKVTLVKALYGRGYNRKEILRLYWFIDHRFQK